jgi:hypothetical protein
VTPEQFEQVRITLSLPDARQLFTLLGTTDQFPDVLAELARALDEDEQ